VSRLCLLDSAMTDTKKPLGTECVSVELDFDFLLEHAGKHADCVTVSILAKQFSEPKQHGTGTLIRIADGHFLVSAAHVFLDAVRANVPLFLGRGGDKLIPLIHVGATYTAEYQLGIDSDDPFDIVVWRLDRQTVDALATQKSFLDQTDLGVGVDLTKGRFLVFGYPTEWSGPTEDDPRTIEQAAIALFSIPYEGRTSHLERYRSDAHVLMRFSRETTQSASTNPHALPNSLVGISGCSLWKLNDENHDQETWRSNFAKVVAVQTCTYSDVGAIRGTRWEGVLGMIQHQWPELSPCLNLILPVNPSVF
jgi:hypothetical protein